MRIHKRWLLVILLSAGQLGCLLAGLLWFANWLEADLSDMTRARVLAANHHSAAQMAQMIEEMGLTDLSPGSADWQRLQSVTERIRLPNQGFLCVIESDTGQLLCHPELRNNAKLREMKPGLLPLHGTGPGRRIMDVTSSEMAASTGWAEMPDGTHLIAVRDLPGPGAKVLAHQRARGITAAIRPVVGRVRKIGLVVAVVLVLVGSLVVLGITQRYENTLARINANLERMVERRSRALVKTRDATIFGLAKLAESRDGDTGEHLERMRVYVELLAKRLARSHPELDQDAIAMLGLTSALHDVGKVGVPDAVLCKPGRLTPHQRAVMQKHTLIGGDCLLSIKRRLTEDDFLETACEIAFSHHERWDGGGYPFGLEREHIPLSARIVALADVYDALTSRRVYKRAMSHEEALETIADGAGAQFDPEVVEAFLAVEARFRAISAAAQKKHQPSPAHVVRA